MNINFEKGEGLVPAIIQDAMTRSVLMLGYMNSEAYEKTVQEKRVTFYSRSKKRLWTKGETSGHFLEVKEIKLDCDNDTLLILARPHGPACHTGSETCFGAGLESSALFLHALQELIKTRKQPGFDKSYTSSLMKKGTNKVAQKVGEEAVEVVIEAMAGNNDLLKEEAADLLYHLLILLEVRDVDLGEVIDVLRTRNK